MSKNRIKNATIEELIEKLEYCGHDGYYNELYYLVIEEIKRRLKKPKEQPEIIRCKDCKYSKLYIDEYSDHYYWCSVIEQRWLAANDYCSHAVKREEGDE